jgi:hypothetical protein
MRNNAASGSWLARMFVLLETKSAFRWLLLVNALVTVAVIWMSKDTILSDTWSYLGLAEGIRHGQYSMWWWLGNDYPDTFRTPGYPLLIALFISVFGTWRSVLVAQFLLYCCSLYLILKTIELIDGRRATRSLFLLLLLPIINVPFYIPQLYTEIPVLAAIGLAVYIAVRNKSWSWVNALVIGLLMGFVFQFRPIFLLFPFIYVASAWVVERNKANLPKHLVMLGMFVLTLVPFGVWNKVHHGIFKVTPLQGAGSFMHIGYWSGKTPGYTDEFYLRNFNGDEMIPFTPKDSIPANIQAYRMEWEEINAQIRPLLNKHDTIMWEVAPTKRLHAEPTYNTAYTLRRDELLRDKAVYDYLNDPIYTIAFKTYSAVRLWVVGIQVNEYAEASVMGKVKMLFITISMAVILLLFLILVPLAYVKRRLSIHQTWVFVTYIVYFTLIHLPFTIQSRYTVPVRFLMLALLAMAITGLVLGKGNSKEPVVKEDQG